MKHILAIETSGKFGSVALARRDNESLDSIQSIDLPRDIGSAQSLAQGILELTRKTSIALSDVGCIALVNGPGSFTGLRVGIATAKSIAYAMEIPVLAIDTLDVIQLQLTYDPRFSQEPFSAVYAHAILDAYRGQIFVKSKNQAGESSESRLIDLADFLEHCRNTESNPNTHIMVGPGVERVKRFLDRELVDGDLKQWFSKVSCWDGQSLEPHAKFVAKIGLQKWAEGSQIDPISLLPNYFRGSAAEEKAKAV